MQIVEAQRAGGGEGASAVAEWSGKEGDAILGSDKYSNNDMTNSRSLSRRLHALSHLRDNVLPHRP